VIASQQHGEFTNYRFTIFISPLTDAGSILLGEAAATDGLMAC
jgi:hypothetical protein